MIYEIDGVLVSEDILREPFACSILHCKGACCEEGDLGAPLEESELALIQQDLDRIKPYLPTKAVDAIERLGFYERAPDGEPVTQTLEGRACVFAKKDDQGHWQCGIEQAWKDGQTTFRKPISCHLYPIRISPLRGGGEALNYDRWDICQPACDTRNNGGTRMYEFLRVALERKYGSAWYRQLKEVASILPEQG
ncbi:MAG: hypothetical protein RL025_422 [Bacteroidota bacterium]|jgi:hypothetical protein